MLPYGQHRASLQLQPRRMGNSTSCPQTGEAAFDSDIRHDVYALSESMVLSDQLHAKLKSDRLRSSQAVLADALRKLWSGWKKPLLLVTPETVVRWHRTGFRLYWSWLSRTRHAAGRKPLSREVRELIFRMVAENPTWGAPRIHGELLKLGFDVSERTVSRWIQRASKDPDPARRWLVFLRNHRGAIAAMDFFTVPTLTFGVLYCHLGPTARETG